MKKQVSNRVALRVTMIYTVLGVLWIIVSDYISFELNSDILKIIQTGVIKGAFFVVVTGVIIYLLVNREIREKQYVIDLLNTEERWQSQLLKSIPNLDAIILDKELHVHFAKGSQLFQEAGIQMDRTRHLEDLPLDKAITEDFKRLAQTTLKAEYPIVEFKNDNQVYELRGVPLFTKIGRVHSALLVSMNVTHQKNLISDISQKMQEYETLYEEYLTANEELLSLNEQLKETNTALKKSRERYRNFFEQLHEGVYRMELEKPVNTNLPLKEQVNMIYDYSSIQECNPSFARMYGFGDVNKLHGYGLDYFYMSNLEENLKSIEKFVENDYQIKDEISVEEDLGGNKKYFLNNRIGIVQDSKLLRIWGTQIDITSQKSHERELINSKKELKDSYEFISNLLDGINDGIAVYDSDFNYQFWNKPLEQFTGKKAEDVIGKNAFDVFPFIEKQGMKDYMKRALKGETVKTDDNQFTNATTGQPLWYYSNYIPNRDSDGNIVGIINVIREITERKNMELALHREKTKAEKSDQLKSAFLANMSHEIRTPMNSIIGFSEILESDEFDGDEKKYYAGVIRKKSNQLLHIINDILDISRIETGEISFYHTDFSVNQLLEELKTDIDFAIAEKKKNLEVRLHKSLKEKKDIITTDRLRLYQVLLNLLSNAEKFTSEGHITLGYKTTKNNKIYFYVTDTGVGIPASKTKTIFERFRQAEDKYNTRKYGGTGLGLPIAKGIINSLGGEIFVETKEGIGTTFSFNIPFKQVMSKA